MSDDDKHKMYDVSGIELFDSEKNFVGTYANPTLMSRQDLLKSKEAALDRIKKLGGNGNEPFMVPESVLKEIFTLETAIKNVDEILEGEPDDLPADMHEVSGIELFDPELRILTASKFSKLLTSAELFKSRDAAFAEIERQQVLIDRVATDPGKSKFALSETFKNAKTKIRGLEDAIKRVEDILEGKSVLNDKSRQKEKVFKLKQEKPGRVEYRPNQPTTYNVKGLKLFDPERRIVEESQTNRLLNAKELLHSRQEASHELDLKRCELTSKIESKDAETAESKVQMHWLSKSIKDLVNAIRNVDFLLKSVSVEQNLINRLSTVNFDTDPNGKDADKLYNVKGLEIVLLAGYRNTENPDLVTRKALLEVREIALKKLSKLEWPWDRTFEGRYLEEAVRNVNLLLSEED